MAAHPRRQLIEAIAEARYELANENGYAGMVWCLADAYALVEEMPDLQLLPDVVA